MLGLLITHSSTTAASAGLYTRNTGAQRLISRVAAGPFLPFGKACPVHLQFQPSTLLCARCCRTQNRYQQVLPIKKMADEAQLLEEPNTQLEEQVRNQ
jgi:hypothetical protein